MRLKKLFEVEVKNRTSKKEANILKRALEDFGFRLVGSFTLIDYHLPKAQKWSRRLRKQRSKGITKFIYSRKKVVQRDGNLKVTAESECQVLLLAESLSAKAIQVCKPRVRHVYKGEFAGKVFSVTIDDVAQRGKYSGYFWEVETLVESLSEVPQAIAEVRKLEKTFYRLMHRGKGRQNCNFCSGETLSHRKMERLARRK